MLGNEADQPSIYINFDGSRLASTKDDEKK